jgi:hypothetical protein
MVLKRGNNDKAPADKRAKEGRNCNPQFASFTSVEFHRVACRQTRQRLLQGFAVSHVGGLQNCRLGLQPGQLRVDELQALQLCAGFV